MAQLVIPIAVILAAGAPKLRDLVSGPPTARIEVGVIYPQTGADSAEGLEVKRGIEFAKWYLNRDGDHDNVRNLNLPLPAGQGLPRLDHAEINFKYEDSNGDHCAPYRLVPQLRDDGMVALIGAYESTVTLAGLRAADDAKIPFVGDASTAVGLTPRRRGTPDALMAKCEGREGASPRPDVRPSRWFFRFGPSDEQAVPQFYGYLRARGLVKHGMRIAIVYENQDLYGNGAFAVTARYFRRRGAVVQGYPYLRHGASEGAGSHARCSRAEKAIEREMETRRYPGDVGDTSHYRLVEGLKHFDPNVIIAAGYSNDAGIFLRLMKKNGYARPPLLAFGAGYQGKNLARVTQSRCELPRADPSGIISRVSWSSTIGHPTRTAEVIADGFEAAYGEAMTENSARAFTAALGLATAINHAGKADDPDTERRNIARQLGVLDIDRSQMISPWGMSFIEKDPVDGRYQNALASVVLERRCRHGGTRVVYPERMASSDAAGCM